MRAVEFTTSGVGWSTLEVVDSALVDGIRSSLDVGVSRSTATALAPIVYRTPVLFDMRPRDGMKE